jgi:hypothetical protein
MRPTVNLTVRHSTPVCQESCVRWSKSYVSELHVLASFDVEIKTQFDQTARNFVVAILFHVEI